MEDDNVLHDLYAIRREGFEGLVIKKNRENNIVKNPNKINLELVNLIKKTVKDEENQKYFLDKIEQFYDALTEEMGFWNEYYYKFGLIDGVKLVDELKEEIKLLRE